MNPEFTRENPLWIAAEDSCTSRKLLAVATHCGKRDLCMAVPPLYIAHKIRGWIVAWRSRYSYRAVTAIVFLIVSDCSIRVYRFFARFLLAVFDALYSFVNLAVMLQENVWILSNYSRTSPYYSGIIPNSFFHLLFQTLFQHNVRMPTENPLEGPANDTTVQLKIQ